MQLIAKQYYTPEEYLELEATANYKSEYIGRQIIAMAGASINHNRISLNLSSGLNFAFRNQNYEVFMCDMRLWIPQKLIYTYPDVIIIAAELWRYDGEVLKFYQLVENQYIEIKFSMAFPLVSVGDMNRFIQQSKTMGEIALLKSFSAWVRGNIG